MLICLGLLLLQVSHRFHQPIVRRKSYIRHHAFSLNRRAILCPDLADRDIDIIFTNSNPGYGVAGTSGCATKNRCPPHLPGDKGKIFRGRAGMLRYNNVKGHIKKFRACGVVVRYFALVPFCLAPAALYEQVLVGPIGMQVLIEIAAAFTIAARILRYIYEQPAQPASVSAAVMRRNASSSAMQRTPFYIARIVLQQLYLCKALHLHRH